MKLTIGMIVKNEEKYLERCLNRIKPILDNVDSELIITDTGSVDRTVEIAKRYTDKVLYLEWINDFAAARNTAIDSGTGEWFMFIDADEIFKSCDNIIGFFNSGEYKKFNSASFVIHNIIDENDESKFTDFNAPRLTKKLSDTKFVGAIHETLNTYGFPIRKLDDIADHYGYIETDKEKTKEKFKRNIGLLKKKFDEEGSSDPLIYPQLFECCLSGEQYDEAERYLELGIEWAKANSRTLLAALYCKKAFYLVAKKRYEESLAICNEYYCLGNKFLNTVKTSKMEMTAIKAFAQYKTGRYDDAEISFCSFFDVFNEVKRGKSDRDETYSLDVRASTESEYLSNVCNYLKCVLKGTKHNYQKIVKVLSSLPICRYSFDSAWVDQLVNYELSILDKTGYSESAACMKRLDSYGQKRFIEKLGQAIYYSDNKSAAAKALAQLSDDAAIKAKADIIERNYSGKAFDNEQLIMFSKQYGITGNSDILMIAMEGGYDISGMIMVDDFDAEKCSEQGYKCYYGFHKAMDTYDINKISDPSALVNAAKLYECSMKYTVDFKSPKPKVYVVLNANRLVERFGQIGERIKNELVEYDSSDAVLNAAVAMGDAVKYRREKKYKACIEAMKNAIAFYQPIAKYVSDYSKEVIDEYNDSVKSQQQQQGMSEMQRLALAVKTNIRTLITAGNITAAQKTLNEYKSIAPKDPDIAELQSDIDAKIIR